MGPEASGRALFAEYNRAVDLSEHVVAVLPLAFRRVREGGVEISAWAAKTIERVFEAGRQFSFDWTRYERLFRYHTKSLSEARRPTKSLERFLVAHRNALRQRIADIPNSLDKARDALLGMVDAEYFRKSEQAYDAMALLHDQIADETVATVVREWKMEAKEHYEQHKNDPIPWGDIFWVSRDFMETTDGVSRYRFRERFEIGEFEPAFDEVERMMAGALLEGSSGREAAFMPFWGDQYLTGVARNLWLVSRSRRMPLRISVYVDMALRRVGALQYADGWWTDFMTTELAGKDAKDGVERSRYLPSIYTTALCSVVLVKLSGSNELMEKGAAGARWLLERQNPDGSWSVPRGAAGKVVLRPDIFVTLLCLEAIVRSGIANVGNSVDLGREWVLARQDELGMWRHESFPGPFLTVLVLEFLETQRLVGVNLGGYMSTAKGFLQMATRLLTEGNPNSRRLATISAYHGIEAFLYGVLSLVTVNVRIFDGSETIGMRKALKRFQSHLQQLGRIGRNEVVLFRNDLDRLAYLRDQVVHKSIDVAESECRELVDRAMDFVSAYSAQFLGKDLFA